MNDEKKSIVIILGSYPNDSETFITNHIIGLIENGFSVKICISKLNQIVGSSQEREISKYNILDYIYVRDIIIPENIIYKIILILKSIICNLSLIVYLARIIKVSKRDRLRKWLRLTKLKTIRKSDVFHIHFSSNGFFLVELKKINFIKKSSKIITTFHGYDAHFTQENLNDRSAELKSLFYYTDKVIVNSDYLKKKIILLGNSKNNIEVIGVPYNSEIFKYKEKVIKNDIILITVGRLIPLKGVKFGILVVKKLLDLGINVHYIIIGDGEDKQMLLNLVDEINISNHVSFLGKKDQQSIANYLNISDIFLMTSITDSNNREEAFGLVSVEAQAVGLPVVAFNTGGVKSTIVSNNTGYLVPEQDIEAMANSIINLINFPKIYLKMSKAASENAFNHFRVEKIINRHLEIYS